MSLNQSGRNWSLERMEKRFDVVQHQYIYETALECLTKYPDSWCLEIGAFCGASTRCIAQAIEDSNTHSKVVSVDPFYGHYDSGLQAILGSEESSWTKFNQELGDLIKWVIPVAAPTLRAQELLKTVSQHFCFAFVDGDHSIEAVEADLGLSVHMILPANEYRSGVILCHDADWPSVQGPIVELANVIKCTLTFEFAMAKIQL